MRKYLSFLVIYSLLVAGLLLSGVNAQTVSKRKAAPKPASTAKPAPPPSKAESVSSIISKRKSGGIAATDPCTTAAPIQLNQPINADLGPGDCALSDGTYIDFYEFQGTAGQAVYIRLDSTAFDTYLYLLDDAGNIIDENDDSGGFTSSRIPVDGGVMTLPYTGDYVIGANSYSPTTGAYTISVNSSAACAVTPISYNQPFNGTLAGGDCAVNIGDQPYYTDIYTFGGKAGDQISITMTSSAVDSYLALHTPSGTGSVEDDNSGGGLNARIPTSGVLTLTETGTYTIEASSSNPAEIGAYTLDLEGVAAPATRRAASDFDGDGKSDVAVWRPSSGVWYAQESTAGFNALQFGTAGDLIVPGDYDGDGKTDFAVFRPSTGSWYMQESTAGFSAMQFGLPTDIPAPGDFDGDGKTDIAVFRPSTGTWYIQQSTAGFNAVQFGQAGDKPVVGDFDGDGKADIAVYRPSNGVWYLLQSTQGFTAVQFGTATDMVVPADYDGDGKTDIAVYRDGSPGTWYLMQSTAGFAAAQFGTTGDIPVPGDYDGDGKADVSVFRPSSGTWYSQESSSGFTAVQFGQTGDVPVESGYVPAQ